MSHDNWYTPKEIIEPIRQFYEGTIDLDPASCIDANEIVKATFYCDGERPVKKGGRGNGLIYEWFGNVYCNPPYCGKGTVERWVNKATEEDCFDKCNQIIMLLNRSDARWYYDFLDNHQGGYYQFRSRIKFIDGSTGKPISPRYNNDLIYWGDDSKGFLRMCLDSFGRTVPSSFCC